LLELERGSLCYAASLVAPDEEWAIKMHQFYLNLSNPLRNHICKPMFSLDSEN